MLGGWLESICTGMGSWEEERDTKAMGGSILQSLLGTEKHWKYAWGLPWTLIFQVPSLCSGKEISTQWGCLEKALAGV